MALSLKMSAYTLRGCPNAARNSACEFSWCDYWLIAPPFLAIDFSADSSWREVHETTNS